MIHVRNLRYRYPGADEDVLHGLDFEVADGEVFGFLGPSGAGKSTTQKVLTGLLDDYSGSAQVFDREVADWGADYYNHVGVSAETPNHYHKLTGRENLALFASLYDGPTREPDELLASVGLADAADKRVSDYSKGMRMRLNFVRALVHDPDLVFLDEPTTGIDPGNARSVKQTIRTLGDEGKTVFLTTHDMTVADQLCDRVAFITDGHLPVIDSPRDLKLDHGQRIVRIEYRRNAALDSIELPLDELATDDRAQSLLASGAVETIHTAEATLEDVFIEITGEELA